MDVKKGNSLLGCFRFHWEQRGLGGVMGREVGRRLYTGHTPWGNYYPGNFHDISHIVIFRKLEWVKFSHRLFAAKDQYDDKIWNLLPVRYDRIVATEDIITFCTLQWPRQRSSHIPVTYSRNNETECAHAVKIRTNIMANIFWGYFPTNHICNE